MSQLCALRHVADSSCAMKSGDVQYFPFRFPSVSPKVDWPGCPDEDLSDIAAHHYRNAVVCQLLRFRDSIQAEHLATYWELVDTILDLSIEVAVQLLQNVYEYRVRKLPPSESQDAYPHLAHEVYRLEYDEPGVFRDVCASALINEAVDLLQEEVERLIA